MGRFTKNAKVNLLCSSPSHYHSKRGRSHPNESGASTGVWSGVFGATKMGKNDENKQNFEIWSSGCFSARKMLKFEYHMSKVNFFSKSAKNGQKMGKNDENEQNFEIWTSGCFSAGKRLIFEGSHAKSQFFSKKCQKSRFLKQK